MSETPECITTARGIELVPPNSWLDEETVWCPVCHTEVRWSGTDDSQRDYKLRHQYWHYVIANGLTKSDWRFLSENVRGHAMLMMEPHGDGRLCWYHSRLDAYTFDYDKQCLRETHHRRRL